MARRPEEAMTTGMDTRTEIITLKWMREARVCNYDWLAKALSLHLGRKALLRDGLTEEGWIALKDASGRFIVNADDLSWAVLTRDPYRWGWMVAAVMDRVIANTDTDYSMWAKITTILRSRDWSGTIAMEWPVRYAQARAHADHAAAVDDLRAQMDRMAGKGTNDGIPPTQAGALSEPQGYAGKQVLLAGEKADQLKRRRDLLSVLLVVVETIAASVDSMHRRYAASCASALSLKLMDLPPFVLMDLNVRHATVRSCMVDALRAGIPATFAGEPENIQLRTLDEPLVEAAAHTPQHVEDEEDEWESL